VAETAPQKTYTGSRKMNLGGVRHSPFMKDEKLKKKYPKKKGKRSG
jgi:hypothetical protein